MAEREVCARGDRRGMIGAFGAGDLGAIAERDRVYGAERFVRRAYVLAGRAEDCEHALAVGDLLAALACSDTVVAAGVLHDVVEDAAVTPDEIVAVFGDEVAGLVGALTEDRSIADYRTRKRALRASVQRSGRAGMLIMAADKLARLRTADEDGVMLEGLELEHYQRSFELLVAGGIHSEQIDELGWRLRLRRGDGPRHRPVGRTHGWATAGRGHHA